MHKRKEKSSICWLSEECEAGVSSMWGIHALFIGSELCWMAWLDEPSVLVQRTAPTRQFNPHPCCLQWTESGEHKGKAQLSGVCRWAQPGGSELCLGWDSWPQRMGMLPVLSQCPPSATWASSNQPLLSLARKVWKGHSSWADIFQLRGLLLPGKCCCLRWVPVLLEQRPGKAAFWDQFTFSCSVVHVKSIRMKIRATWS